MKPLSSLRVLDLSKVLAGPICTQALASFGADVIKVENQDGGDESRFWAPVAQGTGAAFLSVNSGKRSIALDLRQAEAREVVRALAGKADIIIESFAPGVAKKLGVDHDSLTAGRQDVICCSISGFGQKGPESRSPGYDAILQAYSGMMALNGQPGGAPPRLPVSPIDQVTGIYASQAILAALLERGKSGKGARIEVSLLESAIKLLAPNLQAYWVSGKIPERAGSAHPSVVPYQLYDTKDRPILLAVANEKFWRLFCEVAGLEKLRDDPRFASNPDRVGNREETDRIVAEAMVKRTAGEWMTAFKACGIPASPLNTIADLAQDEHSRQLGMFRSFDHPLIGSMETVCEPMLFDGQRSDPTRPPPLLGEHTQEILRDDLGYSDAHIARLVQRGAAACPSAVNHQECAS